MRHYIVTMKTTRFLAVFWLILPIPLVHPAAEPYGKNLVIQGSFWPSESRFFAQENPLSQTQADVEPDPEAPPEANSPQLESDTLVPDEQLRGAIAALESRAQELEYSAGPYAPGLAEDLGDLARLFEASGQSVRALEIRERALHLVRVNEGLYSPAQGPLVRAILESLRAAGEYQALDDRYSYFFRLYGAGRPPWSDARWSATMEYLRWQREALRRGLGGDVFDRLLRLHEIHEDILVALDADESPDGWKRYRDVTLSQMKTLYLVEDLVEPVVEFADMTSRDRMRRQQQGDFDLRRERLESLHRTLRARGRALIEAALARVPQAEIEARARLRLALADWLHWQGSRLDAKRGYLELWQDLQQSGLGSLANQWFSKPVPLPANGVFVEEDRLREGPFELALELSESGRPRVIAAGASSEGRRGVATLRRQVNALRFRPVILAGETVEYRTRLLPFMRLRP